MTRQEAVRAFLIAAVLLLLAILAVIEPLDAPVQEIEKTVVAAP